MSASYFNAKSIQSRKKKRKGLKEMLGLRREGLSTEKEGETQIGHVLSPVLIATRLSELRSKKEVQMGKNFESNETGEN